jgi:hypothetical protein
MAKKVAGLFLISLATLYFTSLAVTAEESLQRNRFVKPGDISLEKAVNRARQTVKMLDDMCKAFIVLIAEEYVKDPTMFSAATLSKKVFFKMDKKGWYKASLIDATGTPNNPDNIPKNKFESDAVEEIANGKSYYERVEKNGGKYYLMAATRVSAVTEGCTICHSDKNLGDLLGVISYALPLERFIE